MKLKPIKANMTEIERNGVTVLFSYKTPVAAHVEGKGYYKTDKYYSSTTTRHITQWLKMNGARTVQEVPQVLIDGLYFKEVSNG